MQRLAWLVAAGILLASSLTAQSRLFHDNRQAVLYVGPTPTVDGDLKDWSSLQGTSPRLFVFGGPRSNDDPSALFVIRTDNQKLYILADVVDSVANENPLPAPLAWRNDSVEIYLGTNTVPHSHFALDDNQIRLVPVSRSEPHRVGVSINDRIVDTDSEVKGTVTFTPQGYRIVVGIPFRLLHFSAFHAGESFRAEFQINDATDAERENLVHWSSPKDDPYFNAASWGNGVVLNVPEAQP